MCGIAGVIHSDEAIGVAAVHRMNGAQSHRGPDDVGVCALRCGHHAIALGHRRLSIQDVSPAGHQPMQDGSTGNTIVYNGELYNVEEVRSELAALGVTFRSRSDTEVVLAAFARWGIESVERFCGMFAFALYAPRDEILYLARDPLGIKPLYLAETNDTIIFASELRAVVAAGFTDHRVDRVALASLLAYGAVVAPRTLLEGVRLVDPGTSVAFELSSMRRRRVQEHWRFPHRVSRESREGQVVTALKATLSSAVASHLISDVPVGVFLSSGVDSTAVAVLAAEAREGDVDTFTVSLADDPSLDESAAARETARRIGCRHHDVPISDPEAVHLARSWFSSLDQPSVDGLNTFLISRAVRERGIVVALSGLGGDEMFGGYSTFREVPALRWALALGKPLAPARRRAIAARLARPLGGARALKAGDLAASDGSILDLCLLRRRLFSDDEMRRFGFEAPEWRQRRYLPPELPVEQWLYEGDEWASIRQLETRLYMGNMLLRDSDVFGMAHALEIRVPLLDRRVVDAALDWSRAPRHFVKGPNKPWLRAALGARLPDHVRPLAKRGFSLPHARWMRGSLRDEVEAALDGLCVSGLVEASTVRGTWRNFLAADRDAGWSRAWLLSALASWKIQTSATKLMNPATTNSARDVSREQSRSATSDGRL